MPPTTMKRIAGELGVSTTTVSKVLNNHDDISPATRNRVLAKVEELGYQRNAVARSLTLRQTHTLGIVIPDLMHSFFVEIIAGIEKTASARGYGLLVCSSNENVRKERSELEMLIGRQVDGIVLASTHGAGNDHVLNHLTALGIGLVMIDRDDHPRLRCHRVLTDDEQVGRLATEHLLDLGRRAVAHIGGPPIAHAKRREQGWRAALEARGIRVPDAWYIEAGFMETDGYQAMTRLLAAEPAIDAVFAANDPAAIGAMKAIWNSGRDVPGDIAVIGAGDIAMGDLLRVPLSTVSWSRQAVGQHAAQLLLGRFDEDADDPPQRIVVAPQVVVRESSAGPPRRGASAPPKDR
jgi:LacI family transcriptional regulator